MAVRNGVSATACNMASCVQLLLTGALVTVLLFMCPCRKTSLHQWPLKIISNPAPGQPWCLQPVRSVSSNTPLCLSPHDERASPRQWPTSCTLLRTIPHLLIAQPDWPLLMRKTLVFDDVYFPLIATHHQELTSIQQRKYQSGLARLDWNVCRCSPSLAPSRLKRLYVDVHLPLTPPPCVCRYIYAYCISDVFCKSCFVACTCWNWFFLSQRSLFMLHFPCISFYVSGLNVIFWLRIYIIYFTVTGIHNYNYMVFICFRHALLYTNSVLSFMSCVCGKRNTTLFVPCMGLQLKPQYVFGKLGSSDALG